MIQYVAPSISVLLVAILLFLNIKLSKQIRGMNVFLHTQTRYQAEMVNILRELTNLKSESEI